MIRRLSNKYVNTITMENNLFMPMILIYMSYNYLFCSQVYTLDNWHLPNFTRGHDCSHLNGASPPLWLFYGLLRSITTKDHHLYHVITIPKVAFLCISSQSTKYSKGDNQSLPTRAWNLAHTYTHENMTCKIIWKTHKLCSELIIINNNGIQTW